MKVGMTRKVIFVSIKMRYYMFGRRKYQDTDSNNKLKVDRILLTVKNLGILVVKFYNIPI